MNPTRRVLSTFRLHLLVTSTTATLCFIATIALSIFLPLFGHLDRYGVQGPAAAGLAEHFLYLHTAFWPVAVGSLAACVVSALLLYYKMTGPLKRFVGCFDRIAGGNCPDEIVIRATDYLSDEADSLNRMLTALKERQRDRAAALDELGAIAEQILERSADDPHAREIAARLCDLKGLR